jgi:signal transduction histidine kinase/CheY-like chemotaxis protein
LDIKSALSFRVKLLLAMMLVVVAITGATLYLAEKNLQAKHQEALNAQFQDQVRFFLALQDAQLGATTEKCRAVARSVRMRAALEEEDVDDLYRNALTELKEIFSPTTAAQNDTHVLRASFFRFFGDNGRVLPPGEHAAGLTDQEALDQTLAPMGKVFRQMEDQATGYIALARGSQPTALRLIVLTKIVDWDNKPLGALVLGFPIGNENKQTTAPSDEIKNGIWLNRQLYIDGLSASDRHLVVQHVNEEMLLEPAGHFFLKLENGPHLLFYKALDPETKFAPAYEVCLYPLANSLREQQILRWKIIAFGLGVLICGFGASLLISKNLSEPVKKIVAGSVENFTKRQRAEQDLRKANRELEKTLTELKTTQQQVIQQERLSAIGQMASGIAHDFNNALTPILGFTDLLIENPAVLQNKDETQRCLSMLRTAAQDATSVVHRLREFYRPLESNEEFPVIDLTKIVEQAVALTEPKWRHQAQASGVTIDVATRLENVPLVAGEESALREVLTNLIFNAVDAMPDGGLITLKTATENDEAILSVSDTGAGMTEAVRQRCLEPFFSTKGALGTGLGLSMVYGIIERHRGKLDIQSAPGQGTTFTIRMPLAALMSAAQLGAAPDVKAGQALNVLVVDDEPRVREVLSMYLACDGHRVTTANSGREGLQRFKTQRFDLVVTDRAMPEMSGDQMASFIKQANPNIPVVLLTGFGALIEVTGAQPRDVDVVLSKPISLNALRKTIENLLHAA